jgi:competence protein ComFB
MYELKNCTELIVAQIADRLLPESNICGCEKCRLDVIALALNQLPAR